jgi:hypothetical protein
MSRNATMNVRTMNQFCGAGAARSRIIFTALAAAKSKCLFFFKLCNTIRQRIGMHGCIKKNIIRNKVSLEGKKRNAGAGARA